MKGLIKYRIRWYVVEVGSLSLAEVLSQYLLAIRGTQLHLTEILQMVGAKCVSYQQAERLEKMSENTRVTDWLGYPC